MEASHQASTGFPILYEQLRRVYYSASTFQYLLNQVARMNIEETENVIFEAGILLLTK
jgi:hypothetical protein